LIQFRKNYGKSAAYSRGFLSAKGRIIITLDADLQDNPGEIPKLLRLLDNGQDLAVGWKQDRLSNEPAKKTASWVFNRIVRVFFGIRLHDSNSGFRAMRREVAKSLELYGDLYRFIPEIAHSKGYKVAETGVSHRRRKFGQTKYGPTRFWTGFLDLITVRFLSRFIQKPLHFFGTVGLFPLSVGLALEAYVLAKKLSGEPFATHLAALIIGVLLILVGLQFIATGLIGEMISKQSKHDFQGE
jgi:glycosyltransferase involved in cell wall biosynthesis